MNDHSYECNRHKRKLKYKTLGGILRHIYRVHGNEKAGDL